MIARIRGEHGTSWGRWRPTAAHDAGGPSGPRTARSPHAETVVPTRRRLRAWMAGVAVIGVACVASTAWLSSRPAPPRLPATPRAWLDAYEAAAVDNPSRVCSELFAPQLARAYGKALRSSCTSYFERITSFSVAVRRVLQDGATAVLELHQTVRPRDWAVILSRRPGGWQAVDLLPGELVR